MKLNFNFIKKRSKPENTLNYRGLSIRLANDAPASIDLESRSVEVVVATEEATEVVTEETT